MDSNIIIAAFTAGALSVKTAKQWQWDRGMILQISGVVLPDVYEVHFSLNSAKASAQRIVGNADGTVEIPDAYFTAGTDIYAWVCRIDSEGVAHTERSITIPVEKRSMPEGISYVLKPTIDFVEYRKTVAELKAQVKMRASGMNGTQIAPGRVIEVVDDLPYVDDVSQYAEYGIAETGWYAFVLLYAPDGVTVTAETAIEGAAGSIAKAGDDHVSLAIRFDVAAKSQAVKVRWDADHAEDITFKATDLAVRNLDYRTTFYVYDLAPYVTWTYALTADATFDATKRYYTKDGDAYTLAEVTAGEAVPVYYVQNEEQAYVRTEDEVFAEGVTYYTKDGDTYTEAEVVAGEPVPAYYNHSKLHIEGATRNITYRLDEIVDCPSEIVLPVIEENTHGAWFEFQLRHSGSFSMTLLPPEGVKVATEHTQAESAGMNMIDLHYMDIDGVKLWRFMNSHSTIPTT